MYIPWYCKMQYNRANIGIDMIALLLLYVSYIWNSNVNVKRGKLRAHHVLSNVIRFVNNYTKIYYLTALLVVSSEIVTLSVYCDERYICKSVCNVTTIMYITLPRWLYTYDSIRWLWLLEDIWAHWNIWLI